MKDEDDFPASMRVAVPIGALMWVMIGACAYALYHWPFPTLAVLLPLVLGVVYLAKKTFCK